ncbi:glycoside hydrolase family 5 protein [Aaosphaeria arxii CBS 175.79]|uniref:glucan 1,3-beta-glucosidase n=1 Tax=Aaosphaeria arxii CBS 175.79 TaxID=1450172 RepID=A0A6A5XMZ6_9PLEO|nr:glycoside hydrolase family 5 protein [Aaosphaeria arxii CBS 175.79]KAF2014249.1 glycoside hydrolase family 5 protein [Aaosphaeria arxii CBS 175.79]
MLFSTAFASLVLLAQAAPNAARATPYINWKTFVARGVNLGGWLHQEAVIDPVWWAQHGNDTVDEWDLCTKLGARCGPVLEHRYATYITTDDIDKLAEAGINLLRIPTGYNAWVKVPGSQLYYGNQARHLQSIANYAVRQYNMHIILDIHSLPGGLNGMGLGEKEGNYGWFQNQTALSYSYNAVDAAIRFIQSSGFPEAFTLAPINEPVDNRDLTKFGTPAALTDAGAAWVLHYFKAVLMKVQAVNPNIPLLLQGSFRHEQYWSPLFSSTDNIAFDVHNYYFAGRPTTSANLPEWICSDAKESAGDGKFPVVIGEWSIQATTANTLASRKANLNTGIAAWERFTRGSIYWTYGFYGNVPVSGEGVQGDYWSYEKFISGGYVDPSAAVPCN